METYRSTARYEKIVVTEANKNEAKNLGVTNSPAGAAVGKIILKEVDTGMLYAVLDPADFDAQFELCDSEPEQ